MLAGAVGLEPTTERVRGACSAIELRPDRSRIVRPARGAPAGARAKAHQLVVVQADGCAIARRLSAAIPIAFHAHIRDRRDVQAVRIDGLECRQADGLRAVLLAACERRHKPKRPRLEPVQRKWPSVREPQLPTGVVCVVPGVRCASNKAPNKWPAKKCADCPQAKADAPLHRRITGRHMIQKAMPCVRAGGVIPKWH